MPRPTVAQFAYGTCTVILSTLVMLLSSRASSGVGIAGVAVLSLVLGVLVAMTVPLSRSRSAAVARSAPREPARDPAGVAAATREPVRERAAS